MFTHNPFGISESDFKRSQDYSFFHNYKLLHGVELNVKNNLDGAMQKEHKGTNRTRILFEDVYQFGNAQRISGDKNKIPIFTSKSIAL